MWFVLHCVCHRCYIVFSQSNSLIHPCVFPMIMYVLCRHFFLLIATHFFHQFKKKEINSHFSIFYHNAYFRSSICIWNRNLKKNEITGNVWIWMTHGFDWNSCGWSSFQALTLKHKGHSISKSRTLWTDWPVSMA